MQQEESYVEIKFKENYTMLSNHGGRAKNSHPDLRLFFNPIYRNYTI
ncbi:MAG: hypothetical protein Fur0044_40430 [Anaerolineae bacterium]